jgi:hypothetical protein
VEEGEGEGGWRRGRVRGVKEGEGEGGWRRGRVRGGGGAEFQNIACLVM